ncbi:hypothetical protein ON010_g18363 [Phytophthora cinnamomi]|nr:hypothetical protein ON010_g18363 [Phytophthora cinnamomi]
MRRTVCAHKASEGVAISWVVFVWLGLTSTCVALVEGRSHCRICTITPQVTKHSSKPLNRDEVHPCISHRGHGRRSVCADTIELPHVGEESCPEGCTEVYNPVTDENGNTYSNDCQMQVAKCKLEKKDKEPSTKGPFRKKSSFFSSMHPASQEDDCPVVSCPTVYLPTRDRREWRDVPKRVRHEGGQKVQG